METDPLMASMPVDPANPSGRVAVVMPAQFYMNAAALQSAGAMAGPGGNAAVQQQQLATMTTMLSRQQRGDNAS
jgi:hypothetical protein